MYVANRTTETIIPDTSSANDIDRGIAIGKNFPKPIATASITGKAKATPIPSCRPPCPSSSPTTI